MHSCICGNRLLQCAVQYLQQGLSIVFVSGQKTPLHPWLQFQHSPMSVESLQSFPLVSRIKGIAVIGGGPSKNFVAYDVDCKNDPNGTIMKDLCDAIMVRNPSLLAKLVIASTPSGGFHFYFFAEQEIESKIIAREKLTGNVYPVLIELRSKSLYSIIPPSPGYFFVQGDFAKIPVLNITEINTLIAAGTFCNRSAIVHPSDPIMSPKSHTILGSPLHDYDQRGDCIALLLSHGWKICPNQKDPFRIYFQRPGKTIHKTSANFHKLHNTFITHSSSTQFTPGKSYKPSAVYAQLECSGDYNLAAKKLLTLGFGIPYVIQRWIGLRS